MLPNCFVIGAPRSGTTSLYEYLNAHPDVYMSPVKEPDFFSRPSLDAVHRPDPGRTRTAAEDARRKAVLQEDLDRYVALFDRASDQKIRGEASAIYLGHPTAAEHLRRYVPDAKLIAILRDPAERLYSHYVHGKRVMAEYSRTAPSDNGAGKSLEEELAGVVDRVYRDGFSEPATTDPEVWVRTGFYYQHLSRFRGLFPEEQLRVYLFEDLVRDAEGLMVDIFRFLEVDESFVLPTTEAFNASVVPRSRGLFRLFTTRNPAMRFARSVSPTLLRAVAMRTRNRVLASSKPPLDPEQRHKFVAIYRQDIEKLQGLLGRDLSAWLDETSGR
jgi:hypothetical protein